MYMCPYARFQSAMFDENTLVISYDAQRGEPRGKRKKGDDLSVKQLGSCVDCTLCVQVCPTGIDIRQGLQYECIGCAACIDVCDDVMAKMNYPSGLIKYTTENSLQGKPTRILRARIIIYSLLLITILSGVVYSIETRDPVELNILRDRNTLYRENVDGSISNSYTLKIINQLSFNGIEGLESSIKQPVFVSKGQVLELPLLLSAFPSALLGSSNTINIGLHTLDDHAVSIVTEGRFIGPLNR